MVDYAVYDSALTQLRAFGPFLKNGFFNHAPMVVEALCALGQGDTAPGWIKAQAEAFTPRPPAHADIDLNAWRDALGTPNRFEDWSRAFVGALDRSPWRDVLDLWARRLSPGFTAAASHGVIETAHAVRALTRQDSPGRRRALADGLAAWASVYSELPVTPTPLSGLLTPEAALAQISRVPEPHRSTAGSITAALATVRHATNLADQISQADLSGDPINRLDELIAIFAGLFLDTAQTPYTAIVFTHAVTGAAAGRIIASETSAETGRAMTFRAWEAGCALKAACSNPKRAVMAQPAPLTDPARAAAAHGDDHVIKLTETCLSAHARRPHPDFLAVIARMHALIAPDAS